MKKIVIHCASGIRNTGDEAILDVLVRTFRERCEITVICLDAGEAEKMHPGVRCMGNGDPGWKAAVEACDLFILGGGGLIQDRTTMFNALRWLQKLAYAQKLGKKTFVYANSLEPLQYGFNRRRAARYLRRADAVTVRDPISLEIARSLGASQTVLTADPVYSYVQEPDADRLRRKLPERYVVMTVRHWYDTHPFIPVRLCNRWNIRSKKNQEKYESLIARLTALADIINEEWGMPVVWLSCCIGRDAKVARAVIERVKQPQKHVVLDDPQMTPSEAMQVIDGAKLLIGMRLHGFIYAFLQKTPVILLSYQEKVRGMAQLAGVEDACFSVDDFDPKQVIQSAELLLQTPELQEEPIAAFVEKMKVQQTENAHMAWMLLGEDHGER